MTKVGEEAFDPIYCKWYLKEEISHINQFLIKDGYIAEIISDKYSKRIKVSQLLSDLVDFPNNLINSDFIKEQVQKCNSKIRENDLDGAITNAQSLVVAVIEDILKTLGHQPKWEGNLPALYKQLKESLNLDPKEEMHQCFKQIASGLISCINGVAQISNTTSDRHSRKYKPLRHHAQLAVDTSFTFCKFLLGVFENKKIGY